jgi:hypothetical protein
MKKIVNYKIFNEQRLNRNILKSDVLNEGLISGFFSNILKSGIFNKLGNWAKTFIDKLMKGKIMPIASGPNAGKPSAFLFLPENGDLFTQMTSIYKFDNDLGKAITVNESLELNEDLSHLKSKTKNIPDISASKLVKLLKDTHANDLNGVRKSIFIYGAPGIGKTQIITQAAKLIGGDIIMVDLEFYMPEDFKGIPSKHDIRPYGVKSKQELEDELADTRPEIKSVKRIEFDEETGKEKVYDYGEGFTRGNLPTIFPRDKGSKGKGGIIFMDEMNRANEWVKKSLMKFLGSGRNIEQYVLPLGWIIVAAGNRRYDDPDFFESLPPEGQAFVQRFIPFNYEPSFIEWANWARGANVLPELVDWLELPDVAENWWHKPHTVDPSSSEFDVDSPWPSPRAWTELSEWMQQECKRQNISVLIPIDDDIKPTQPGEINKSDLKNEYLTPFVGFNAATAFLDYLEIITKVTLAEREQIYNTPALAPIKDSMKDANGQISSSVFYSVNRFLIKHCKDAGNNAQTATNAAHTLVWSNKMGKAELLTYIVRITKDSYSFIDKNKLNLIDDDILDIFYDSIDDKEDPAQVNPTITYGAPKSVDYMCKKILSQITANFPNEASKFSEDYIKLIRAIMIFNLIEETGKGDIGSKLKGFKQSRQNRKKP